MQASVGFSPPRLQRAPPSERQVWVYGVEGDINTQARAERLTLCGRWWVDRAGATTSSRQHLATPDMHANEVLAAGTIMHKIVPIRGLLTEAHIAQEAATPPYIDSASPALSRRAVEQFTEVGVYSSQG